MASSKRRRLLTSAILLATATAVPRALADAAAPSRDDQLKAAFVSNFVQLTEWPDEAFDAADAPVVIAVVNGDGMAAAIEALVSGRRADGRTIVVRRRNAGDDVGRCHALVVPGEHDRPRDIVAAAAGRPVLIVGEGDNFLPAGGTIRFFTEEKKMRFEINQPAATRSGLKISSKLLRLAKIYK